jgi:hypothetical protein
MDATLCYVNNRTAKVSKILRMTINPNKYRNNSGGKIHKGQQCTSINSFFYNGYQNHTVIKETTNLPRGRKSCIVYYIQLRPASDRNQCTYNCFK